MGQAAERWVGLFFNWNLRPGVGWPASEQTGTTRHEKRGHMFARVETRVLRGLFITKLRLPKKQTQKRIKGAQHKIIGTKVG